MAEDLGDQDKAKQIQDQLNELEERAEALDRQRTKNISAIRCVTDPFRLGSYPWSHRPCHRYQATHGLARAVLHWLRVAPGPGVRAQWSPPSFPKPLTYHFTHPQLHQPAEPGVEHCRV